MRAVDSTFGGLILLVLVVAAVVAILTRRRRPPESVSFDDLQPKVYFESGQTVRSATIPKASRRANPNIILSAQIAYCDANGEYTKRVIDIFRITLIGEELSIEAYCRLRSDVRTFWASRIEELIDLSTGEVIDDPEDLLLSHPAARGVRKKPADDDIRKIDVPLLTFVARSDGRLSKAERSAIESYVETTMSNGRRIPIPTKGPGIDEFKTALRRAQRLPADRRTKLLAAINLLAAGKPTKDPVLSALLDMAHQQLGPVEDVSRADFASRDRPS